MIAASAVTTGRHARPYDHDAELARIARTGIVAWGRHRRASGIWQSPGVSARWTLVRKGLDSYEAYMANLERVRELGSSGSES